MPIWYLLPFHSSFALAPVAVAYLFLVRPMRARLVLTWFIAANACGTIRSVSDLQPAQLVGTWEAIAVHLGVPTTCVYQISFSAPDTAYFVAATSQSAILPPMFLGKLTSSELKDGHITLRFSAVSDSADYEFQRVDVAGRASASGDDAYIDGKITVRRRNGHAETEPVLFANKLWVKDLKSMSEAAQEILRHRALAKP
jgi:hypothetical protein